jgi:hypothetical protein
MPPPGAASAQAVSTAQSQLERDQIKQDRHRQEVVRETKNL